MVSEYVSFASVILDWCNIKILAMVILLWEKTHHEISCVIQCNTKDTKSKCSTDNKTTH